MHVNTEESPRTLTVTFPDGRTAACPPGAPVRDLLAQAPPNGDAPVLGALINNEVTCLTCSIVADVQVEFLTIRTPLGWRIYRSTMAFLLSKTVESLYPEAEYAVEHSLGSGLFCRLEFPDREKSEEDVRRIETALRDLVAADRPVVRRKISFGDAVRLFQNQKQMDKYKLLRFRNQPYVDVVECDGTIDLCHAVLADRTGSLSRFRCVAHEDGFVIQFPERERPDRLGPFEHQPHLFHIFQEHKRWGRILGVRTVGDLNEIGVDGDIADFIRTAEALHEKRIATIADQISARADRVRWIFIAGPSSSGKTTFAKRLAVHLKVNGLHCTTLSVDDYFVDRERTPLDGDGRLDFEHLRTVDLPFLHEHFLRLDRGEEVELPRFNFEHGRREFRGERMKIHREQLVLVEGIHCLNPDLLGPLPPAHGFKIYVSALAQLNIDFHNRMSTTDNRLIRRIVRDHQFRANHARTTIGMWPAVRRGEKTWIFPYQANADVAFNSALDYELGVLKPFVEPLLLEVKPYDVEYATARRLQEFLSNFLSIPASQVPPTSILREFIGRSSFRY
jgi:uridine kinase